VIIGLARNKSGLMARSIIFVILVAIAAGAAPSVHAARPQCESLLRREHARTAPGRELVNAYFRFAAQVKSLETIPEFLQPQMVRYLIDELRPRQQTRLAAALDHATALLAENASLPPTEALALAMHPRALTTVIKIHGQVAELRARHKDAVALAIASHDGQRWGDKPYRAHLKAVHGVLKRFGFGPRTSILGLKLGTAAWLHDILEDTHVTREAVEKVAGKEITDLVFALSNDPERPGVSEAERKRAIFERIGARRETRILKLADRIANVEESLVNEHLGADSKIEKYRREWPDFKKYLYRRGEADAMWRYLERLLTDEARAREFVLSRSR
jgi:hypothetical protein